MDLNDYVIDEFPPQVVWISDEDVERYMGYAR